MPPGDVDDGLLETILDEVRQKRKGSRWQQLGHLDVIRNLVPGFGDRDLPTPLGAEITMTAILVRLAEDWRFRCAPRP